MAIKLSEYIIAEQIKIASCTSRYFPNEFLTSRSVSEAPELATQALRKALPTVRDSISKKKMLERGCFFFQKTGKIQANNAKVPSVLLR